MASELIIYVQLVEPSLACLRLAWNYIQDILVVYYIDIYEWLYKLDSKP